MTVRRLAVAAVIVAVFSIASRVLGFLRDIVLAAKFGGTIDADAFVSSLVIVNSIAAVLLYALVTVIIPEFQRERAEAGGASAWRLVWALTAWVSLVLIVIASAFALFPEIGSALFRTNPELARQMEPLIRIVAPAVLLQGLSALFTALLQIHGRFAGPAAIGVAFNTGIIGLVLLLADRIGIEAAAWGVTAGATLQLLLQIPQFVGLVRRSEARPALTHPRLLGTAVVAAPIFAASIVQQINNFSDKIFASTLDDGSVATLTWANTLGQAPRAVLLLPLMTPLFPLIARLVAEGRRPEVVEAYRRATGLLGVLAIPVAAFMLIYADELSHLFFERGRCDAACAEGIASPLAFYAIAVWAGFMGYLNNRVLSAAGRTRDVMTATILVVALTIALDFILIGPLGTAGLALASALALFVNVAVTLHFVRRQFTEVDPTELGVQQVRLLAAALLGTAAALLANLLFPGANATGVPLLGLLAIKAGIAGVIYAIAVRLIAPKEFRDAQRTFGAAIRRRKAAEA